MPPPPRNFLRLRSALSAAVILLGTALPLSAQVSSEGQLGFFWEVEFTSVTEARSEQVTFYDDQGTPLCQNPAMDCQLTEYQPETGTYATHSTTASTFFINDRFSLSTDYQTGPGGDDVTLEVGNVFEHSDFITFGIERNSLPSPDGPPPSDPETVYYVYSDPADIASSNTERSFFRVRPNSGVPDTVILIDEGPQSTFRVRSRFLSFGPYYEDVLGDRFVSTYNMDAMEAADPNWDANSSDQVVRGVFLARVGAKPTATSRVFTMSSASTARVRSDWRTDWDLPNLTVEFPQGKALIIEGELDADGATFTASDPAQGWSGIRFEPGSGGIIDQSTITGGGLFVNGASPTISNSTVEDGRGVEITGAAGPVLRENFIQRNDYGVQLYSMPSGYKAILDGNTIVQNSSSGVWALFSGTAYLTGNRIGVRNEEDLPNGGVGAHASFGSTLLLRRPTPEPGQTTEGFNVIASNTSGGILAEDDYTSVQAGASSATGSNSFYGNGQSGIQWNGGVGPDAESYTNALLEARYDWWGQPTRPDTTTGPRGGSGCVLMPDETIDCSGGGYSHSPNGVLYVDPMLASAPNGGPQGNLSGGGSNMVVAGVTSASVAAASINAPTRGETADTPASTRAALLAATEAANRGDAARALGLLRAAAASGGAVRGVALSQAARLCGPDPVSGTPVTGQVGRRAEAFLRDGGGTAHRALLACLVASGQDPEALEVAETLAARPFDPEQVRSSDAFYGRMTAVHVYLRAGRTAEAGQALAQARQLAPTDRAVAVAASALGSAGGMTTRVAEDALAQTAATLGAASVTDEGDSFSLDTPHPNPTAQSAKVPFRLSSSSVVSVEAYDVLGRQVARTAGTYGVGAHHVTLDVSGLPAGVYLVRATAHSEGSTPTVRVRSLTVAR